jgi:multidrug efflux pump subunit AcrB
MPEVTDQAVIDAGAVRFRPMMLTAAAVIVGASGEAIAVPPAAAVART